MIYTKWSLLALQLWTQNDSICLEMEAFSQTSPMFLEVQCLASYGQNILGIWVNMGRTPQGGGFSSIWCLVNPTWAFSILTGKFCSLLFIAQGIGNQPSLSEIKIEPTLQFKFLESFPWSVAYKSLPSNYSALGRLSHCPRWSSLTPWNIQSLHTYSCSLGSMA